MRLMQVAVRKREYCSKYCYTYDAADNMLTKKEPFEDDFEDGAYTGWTANGPWSASTGQMVNTADSGCQHRSEPRAAV
jgi:hypothetical protein